jgi:CYTH domain-containing protein
VIPAWLAPVLVREVTDDPAFTNAAIAQRIGRTIH